MILKFTLLLQGARSLVTSTSMQCPEILYDTQVTFLRMRIESREDSKCPEMVFFFVRRPRKIGHHPAHKPKAPQMGDLTAARVNCKFGLKLNDNIFTFL